MTSLILLALTAAWAYIVDSVEDYLPSNQLGFAMLCLLCVVNPFLWLFFGSLT